MIHFMLCVLCYRSWWKVSYVLCVCVVCVECGVHAHTCMTRHTTQMYHILSQISAQAILTNYVSLPLSLSSPTSLLSVSLSSSIFPLPISLVRSISLFLNHLSLSLSCVVCLVRVLYVVRVVCVGVCRAVLYEL